MITLLNRQNLERNAITITLELRKYSGLDLSAIFSSDVQSRLLKVIGVCFRDYMDRLVDETESLGGTVNSSALTSNRPEPIPDQQLNILSSFTASDLTGKMRSLCAVCYKSFVCVTHQVTHFSYSPFLFSFDQQCSNCLQPHRCELSG